jgi:hypothetical protein
MDHPDLDPLHRWAKSNQLVILQSQSYEVGPVRGHLKHRVRVRFPDGTIRTGWVQFAPAWPHGPLVEPDVTWEGYK